MSSFLAASMTVFVLLFALSLVTVAQEENYRTFQEAKLISLPDPVLPNEAKETGLGGKVTVLVSIDNSGKVSSVSDVKGPDFTCSGVTRLDVIALRDAARTAALKATFSPAIGNGQPVGSQLALDFWFATGGTNSLDDDKADKPRASDGPPVQLPKTLSGGVLQAAIELPKPAYPAAARAVRASGSVSVQVLIDTNGRTFSAHAVTGHPLLRAAAESAACGARFTTTLLSGQPVKVSGIITYNFIP